MNECLIVLSCQSRIWCILYNVLYNIYNMWYIKYIMYYICILYYCYLDIESNITDWLSKTGLKAEGAELFHQPAFLNLGSMTHQSPPKYYGDISKNPTTKKADMHFRVRKYKNNIYLEPPCSPAVTWRGIVKIQDLVLSMMINKTTSWLWYGWRCDGCNALDTEYLTTVIQNVTSFPCNFNLAGQNSELLHQFFSNLRLCQSMTSIRFLKSYQETCYKSTQPNKSLNRLPL